MEILKINELEDFSSIWKTLWFNTLDRSNLFYNSLSSKALHKQLSINELHQKDFEYPPVTNLEGVLSPVCPVFLFWFFEAPEPSQLFEYYQESCRTGQRFGTPCTGPDYNLLSLKGLHKRKFGQPPRGYIIHRLEGQGNDKDPGNSGIDQASLDYSPDSTQNDFYAILVPRIDGFAYGL